MCKAVTNVLTVTHLHIQQTQGTNSLIYRHVYVSDECKSFYHRSSLIPEENIELFIC